MNYIKSNITFVVGMFLLFNFCSASGLTNDTIIPLSIIIIGVPWIVIQITTFLYKTHIKDKIRLLLIITGSRLLSVCGIFFGGLFLYDNQIGKNNTIIGRFIENNYFRLYHNYSWFLFIIALIVYTYFQYCIYVKYNIPYSRMILAHVIIIGYVIGILNLMGFI